MLGKLIVLITILAVALTSSTAMAAPSVNCIMLVGMSSSEDGGSLAIAETQGSTCAIKMLPKVTEQALLGTTLTDMNQYESLTISEIKSRLEKALNITINGWIRMSEADLGAALDSMGTFRLENKDYKGVALMTRNKQGNGSNAQLTKQQSGVCLIQKLVPQALSKRNKIPGTLLAIRSSMETNMGWFQLLGFANAAPAAPRMDGASGFIPARFVFEALGYKVGWSPGDYLMKLIPKR